jgi:prepilin-type processing-associated H-X9-DG protein
MHPVRMRGRIAFTIIELLVAIAVAAVLLSLLLPALARAKTISLTTKCLSQERTIGQAVVLYQNVYKDWFPLSSHTAGSLRSPGAWLQSLEELGAPDFVRLCPVDPYRTQKLTSYATNDHFEPLTPGIDYNAFTGKTLPGGRTIALTRVFEIPRPCAVVYAVEASGTGTVDHIHSVGWTLPSDVSAAIAVTRHEGGANYLYADGHAERIPWFLIQASFSSSSSLFDPLRAP